MRIGRGARCLDRTIVAAVVSALSLSLSREAGAFEVKHTRAGELVSWRRSSVALTLDPSLRHVDGGEDAAFAAAAAWSESGRAPALSTSARATPLEPGYDQVSAIFFAKDGFAPAGDALAVTLLAFDDRTGEVLDADVVLNGAYRFAPMPAGTACDDVIEWGAAEPYDIRRVLAHELGHALGLGDEPAHREALMYPYLARAVAVPASPAADDLAGLTVLYATRANGAEHAGCAVVAAPAAPTSATARLVIALAVAALATSLSRRGTHASASRRTGRSAGT
jgi:hypothetical protein